MGATAPRPVALDELLLTVVVDNETDTLSSVDAGVPQLPELASLLGRTPVTRLHESRRSNRRLSYWERGH